MQPKTSMLNIRMATEMLERVQALADQEQRKVSDMARLLMAEALQARDQVEPHAQSPSIRAG